MWQALCNVPWWIWTVGYIVSVIFGAGFTFNFFPERDWPVDICTALLGPVLLAVLLVILIVATITVIVVYVAVAPYLFGEWIAFKIKMRPRRMESEPWQ